MKKLISILVAFAMMATLAVTMSFAATNQSINLANCKITKIYDVPTGVAAPEAKFYFKVTPTEFPKSTALNEKFEYIEYAANAAGGEVSKNLPLSDFIAYGKNASGKDFNLTQPGEYEFTVVEVAGTPAGIASDAEKPANTSYFVQDTDTTTAENLAFEGKQYTLRIYLVNGATDLEVRAVTLVDSTKTDDDTTEDVDESKVSPETGFQFKNGFRNDKAFFHYNRMTIAEVHFFPAQADLPAVRINTVYFLYYLHNLSAICAGVHSHAAAHGTGNPGSKFQPPQSGFRCFHRHSAQHCTGLCADDVALPGNLAHVLSNTDHQAADTAVPHQQIAPVSDHCHRDVVCAGLGKQSGNLFLVMGENHIICRPAELQRRVRTHRLIHQCVELLEHVSRSFIALSATVISVNMLSDQRIRK